MIPQEIPGATRRMAAPPDWDHERDGICHTLEIIDTPEGWMISGWRPSPAELARINAGEPVLLCIQGQHHPVVALYVAGAKEGSREAADPNSCPGHVASAHDPKVCGRCGLHADSERPGDDQP